MGYDMGDMMDGYMMGGGLLWGLLALLVLGILVAVMVALVVYTTRRGADAQGRSPAPGGGVSAEDILRRRYAAGEIDEDEYTRRSQFIGR